jgi:Tfp pilus assembly protein PilX
MRIIRRDKHDSTGVALVVTLALLVLVTVAVLAFFTRATTNQRWSKPARRPVSLDKSRTRRRITSKR